MYACRHQVSTGLPFSLALSLNAIRFFLMLNELLVNKKTKILDRWFDSILETYPKDSARFIKKEKDRFANPAGHAIVFGLEGIFEELLKDECSKEIGMFLDKIIRIRSVQDYSPSQTVNFIFFLKKIIKEVLKKEIRENHLSKEIVELEARIDNLALLGFDVYMQCREQIYALRVDEVKRQKESALRMLDRANSANEKLEKGGTSV